MTDVPIGDPRPAGQEGPAGDQRAAGEEGPAGDPRPSGEQAPTEVDDTTPDDEGNDKSAPAKKAKRSS